MLWVSLEWNTRILLLMKRCINLQRNTNSNSCDPFGICTHRTSFLSIHSCTQVHALQYQPCRYNVKCQMNGNRHCDIWFLSKSVFWFMFAKKHGIVCTQTSFCTLDTIWFNMVKRCDKRTDYCQSWFMLCGIDVFNVEGFQLHTSYIFSYSFKLIQKIMG